MAKKKEKVLGHDPFANGDPPPVKEDVGVTESLGKKPEAEPKVATEASPVEAEKKSKAETKPKAKKKTTAKTKVKPEAEAPLEQVSAEPDEETGRPLDELIATIDKEIEETFGPSAMADLTPAKPTDQGENEEQYVIFSLAGSEYAVLAANVREIGDPPHITPVPNVPDWVLGVANLRGDILSLVDLSAFLGMEWTDYDADTQVMVVHAQQGASSVTTGLMVDLVSDIRYLPVDQIVAPTAPIEDRVALYLHGVYEQDGHLLAVLNLDRLLLSPEMWRFEPV